MMPIEPKTIGELKGLRFFVPAYQRGYRWTEQEVVALLDDIDEFKPKNDKEQYCIQPLIVRNRTNGIFEVVDGQQRLTTIYIFMKIASEEIRSAVPPFSLEYETRKDSSKFLESLSADIKQEGKGNIDYYHIVRAYEVMNTWFDYKPDKSVAIQKLNTKMREKVFFIWHELSDNSDPIAMFTKVNIGKIPLTNAELIKALLLNKDNFAPDNKDINRLQLEISVAWDRIEQGLQDDTFWYFLNETEHSGTRIDLLFRLLADEWNMALDVSIKNIDNQEYYPFLVFQSALKDAENNKKGILKKLTGLKSESGKNGFVKTLWEQVEALYAEFRDWYSDLNKYHIIGYLIATGVKIPDVFIVTRDKGKSAVIQALLEKCGTVPTQEQLFDMVYDKPNDRKNIRKFLLLFNIASLVCKSEKQYRFPFDIYKKEKWDIEHIHATADETDEPDDRLCNLTLLDYETNRSYKDAPFSEKRRIIIDRESKGLFVPLCTKNVFLKVYSNDVKDMCQWEDNDKEYYICKMVETLELFFDRRFV
jgi:hypothetical protein